MCILAGKHFFSSPWPCSSPVPQAQPQLRYCFIQEFYKCGPLPLINNDRYGWIKKCLFAFCLSCFNSEILPQEQINFEILWLELVAVRLKQFLDPISNSKAAMVGVRLHIYLFYLTFLEQFTE